MKRKLESNLFFEVVWVPMGLGHKVISRNLRRKLVSNPVFTQLFGVPVELRPKLIVGA